MKHEYRVILPQQPPSTHETFLGALQSATWSRDFYSASKEEWLRIMGKSIRIEKRGIAPWVPVDESAEETSE